MASQRDIAEMVGTSLSTVSIVLNGQAAERKISQETQDKILAATRELGYTPNVAARSLRMRSQRKTIMLYWADDYREMLLPRFLRGIHSALSDGSDNSTFAITSYTPGSVSESDSGPDAAAFNAIILANAKAADVDYMAATHPLLPIVLYNRQDERFQSAYVDNEQVGELLAKAVGSYRSIMLLEQPETYEGGPMRLESAERALLAAGKRVNRLACGGNQLSDGFEAASRIDFDVTDAVIAPSDLLGMGVISWCHANGIAIPEDVGIVAVGNGLPEYDEASSPTLSTIEIPMEEMATECLRLVERRMSGNGLVSKSESISFAPRFVPRGSLRQS